MEAVNGTPVKAVGFEFSTLQHVETTTIQITHPATGDDLPGVTATIYGPDSEIAKSATRKAEHKYTEYIRRNKGKFMPPEAREQLDFDKMVSCIKSIDGILYNGAPLTDVTDIMTRFPFIKEQINLEMVDRGNFIKS